MKEVSEVKEKELRKSQKEQEDNPLKKERNEKN